MLYFTENGFVIFLVIIIYVFFASLCSNLLIIPTYELLLFSFIRYKNIFAHLMSIKSVMNIIHGSNEEEIIIYEKSNIISDILFLIIEFFYFIGFILGFFSQTMIFKDIIREIIFIIIYFYYLVIFFAYIFVAFDLKIQIIIKIIKKCRCLIFWSSMDEYIKEIFQGKVIPEINLLCYVVNPLLEESYEGEKEQNQNNLSQDDKTKNCYDCIIKSCWCCLCRWFLCCSFCCYNNFFYTLKNIVRPISFIGSFILAMIIVSNQGSEIYVYFLLIFFYLFSYVLSSLLNFPYIIRNIKVFFMCSTAHKYKEEYQLAHPMLIGFIRLISFLVIFVFSIFLLIIFVYKDETDNLSSISGYEFSPIPETINKTKLKPNICFSSIHNMYIYLFLPFINDAYYYDNNPKISPYYYSSFQIKDYKGLFFEDELYDIKSIGNLINSNDLNKVKMVQYDVIKKKKGEDGKLFIENEMTILAIKGTTNKKDIFLDIQLYLPSVLLNYLSYFSLLSRQKDTYSFGYLEYSLSLPYRLFSQYLIIDGYLRNLLDAYNNKKSTFKNNVIIVGHSLGGGLAKLLGRFLASKQFH